MKEHPAMSTPTTPPAAWPRVEATLHEDGTAQINVGGTTQQVAAADPDDARQQTVAIIAARAAQLGRPLRTLTCDPSGEWTIVVHPDGSVTEDEEPSSLPLTEGSPRRYAANSPAPSPQSPAAGEPTSETAASEGSSTVQNKNQPFAIREARERSFLADARMSTPPPTGWRAFLARFGFRSGPTDEEMARWEDQRSISQHWPGPRTIAVLNGKGGAGKTPATALLAAMFARAGGSGVLAWDNNVTRGTLGWRTESGPHDATVLDLIPRAEELLSPGARAADLAAVVHHQTIDKYDVLRSNPLLLSTEQKLTPNQLDAVHAVATKYYRLIFMDSGNDEGDALWLRMIDHADQIVVATSTRPDHAEAGRLLLNALADRDEHSAQLVDKAVVLVSQADREEAEASSIAQGYADLARAVVTVPYDPAMRQQWLRVDNLAPATQRAYLRAAAAVASGL